MSRGKLVHSPGRVAVWVSDFASEAQLEAIVVDEDAACETIKDFNPSARTLSDLVAFLDGGEVLARAVAGVRVDGRVNGVIAVYDHALEGTLSRRGVRYVGTFDVPRAPALPPVQEWAERLVAALRERNLIELDGDTTSLVATIARGLKDLGREVLTSSAAADDFADFIAELDGVRDVFATADELQEIARATSANPPNRLRSSSSRG